MTEVKAEDGYNWSWYADDGFWDNKAKHQGIWYEKSDSKFWSDVHAAEVSEFWSKVSTSGSQGQGGVVRSSTLTSSLQKLREAKEAYDQANRRLRSSILLCEPVALLAYDQPDDVTAFRNFIWRRDEVKALEFDVQSASAAVAVAQSAVDALVIEARTEMPKVTADAVYGEEVSSLRLAEGALGHGDAAVVMPGPAEATDAELNDEQGAAREAVSNGSCECGGGSFVFRIPLFFSLAFSPFSWSCLEVSNRSFVPLRLLSPGRSPPLRRPPYPKDSLAASA